MTENQHAEQIRLALVIAILVMLAVRVGQEFTDTGDEDAPPPAVAEQEQAALQPAHLARR